MDKKNVCIICGKEKEDYEASMCDKCWKEESTRLKNIITAEA